MKEQTFPSILKEESGSSSILVIILMVVLMVFGLAVLTTSLSNIRLSEKKRDWLADYYTVEAIAESRLATIDDLLSDAELEAHEYMESGAYVDEYMIDTPVHDDAYLDVLALVYHDIMVEVLSNYIDNNPHASLIISDCDSILNLDVSGGSGEFPPKHIALSLAILCPPTSETVDGQNLLLKHFDIRAYKEWQEPFAFDEASPFDDPFEDIEEGQPFEENTIDEGNPFESLEIDE